jgi:hypothetical protein
MLDYAITEGEWLKDKIGPAYINNKW